MDLTGESVSVYSEAKGEYTKQLSRYMLPALQQYFLDMLDEAKRKEPEAKRILMMFQQLLEGITEWNVDKVQRETSALTTAIRCDYLEELLTAVFIAHTKVLSAIRLTVRQKKLQITIPRLDHFLHRTLTECSRLLWSNVYLFSSSAPSIERQKNLRGIESILQLGIQQAIRGMLPVKNILREYLREDDETDDDDGEDEPDEKEEKDEKEEAAVIAPVEEKAVTVPVAAAPLVEETADAVVDASADAPVVIEEKTPIVAVIAAPTENKEAATVIKTRVDETQPVSFTGIDTAFVDESKDKDSLPDEKNDAIYTEEVKILDGSPEPMDEFEDLDKKDETLQMDFDELM